MLDSFEGLIGAGSAPERRSDSSVLARARTISGSPPPIVIEARPPEILLRMTGAELISSSKMIAKRLWTFAPVTSSKRSAPFWLNVMAT